MTRCIKRLEEDQKGSILVDGIDMDNNLKHIKTIRKDMSMVFEHFNLFAHLFSHLFILENLRIATI